MLCCFNEERRGNYSASPSTSLTQPHHPPSIPPRKGEGRARHILHPIPDRLTASGMTDDPPEARQVTDEICPPSTRRIEPVMNEALSLARNTAAAANSSISP